MPEVKTAAPSVIDLVDESFDLKKSNTCHLSILVTENSTSYAILDTNTNKYLVLKQIPFIKEDDILTSFRELGVTSFRSVTCAVSHNKFALIPSALFDDENKESLLGFNHPMSSEEKIHSDTVRSLDAKNLFSLSRTLESTVRKQFPNVHFIHNSTPFIEGLLVQNKNNSGKKVFADFASDHFTVAILDGRELLFSNAFSYKTAEDIAYYMLFVYEQLHLNPEVVELILSGAIEKTAKEHSLLYNYIHHVKFAVRPDGFQYSYKFHDIQGHNFFSLFNQYLISN